MRKGKHMRRVRHLDTDSLWPYRSIRAALVIGVIVIFVTCALVACEGPVVADEVPTSPGRPLDAVKYEAPTWAEGDWCYLAYDRTRDCMWWLVQMRDGYGKAEWVTLPIAVRDVNEALE